MKVIKIGKLRAMFRLLLLALVDLPHGRLIDLGPNLDCMYDGGSTEIFVYKGKVRYEGFPDSVDSFTREISRVKHCSLTLMVLRIDRNAQRILYGDGGFGFHINGAGSKSLLFLG